jgi:hypothetical protein
MQGQCPCKYWKGVTQQQAKEGADIRVLRQLVQRITRTSRR